MPKKPGRGPRKNRSGGGAGGQKSGGARRGGRGAPRGGAPGGRGKAPRKSDYFMQPGKRGVFVVLRRPIGNRINAKVCGTMPSRVHAKMLIDQLERAESVVKDLFMEATDDGIEALEAVLAASCEDVLRRGPAVRTDQPEEPEAMGADEADYGEGAPAPESDDNPYAEGE